MLRKRWTWMLVREGIIQGGLALCALVSVATTALLVFVLLRESVLFFQDPLVSVWDFLTGTVWSPDVDRKFGIVPLLSGTVLVAGTAAVVGLPTGLGAALYLSEYASPRTRAIVKPILEIIAGIPSIVLGYFALMFITPWLLKPLFEDLLGLNVNVFNAASAGIAVGIMIIPTVASLSEDVLRSVPQGLREAGYALGSTKFDVSVRIVVPAALSGILASFLLAISRAVGETMAVAIAGGTSPRMALNPLTSVQTMTAFIATRVRGDAEYGTVEYRSLYAVAAALFFITLVMNLLGQMILRRSRNVYH